MGIGKQALFFTMLLIALVEAAMSTTDSKDKVDKFVISPTKTIVRIYNKLGEGLNLTIHCKSKDDDLGVSTVAYNSYFYWKFRVNFLGTTLFFCGLSWRDASGVFDMYKAKRDMKRCPTRCNWEAQKDLVQGLRQGDNVHDMAFNWTYKT
ncbi:S-protein homolog 3-like [Ziziphus jujuba]|uniref:S-protein homolog n=1 Tax=Ziziphus jujuba TaxID=326968 RepID=A0A6P3ZZ29_ZIZJJ|nr:S-protein homolog 3-like [Ziziphus jujuba]